MKIFFLLQMAILTIFLLVTGQKSLAHGRVLIFNVDNLNERPLDAVAGDSIRLINMNGSTEKFNWKYLTVLLDPLGSSSGQLTVNGRNYNLQLPLIDPPYTVDRGQADEAILRITYGRVTLTSATLSRDSARTSKGMTAAITQNNEVVFNAGAMLKDPMTAIEGYKAKETLIRIRIAYQMPGELPVIAWLPFEQHVQNKSIIADRGEKLCRYLIQRNNSMTRVRFVSHSPLINIYNFDTGYYAIDNGVLTENGPTEFLPHSYRSANGVYLEYRILVFQEITCAMTN